MIPQVSDYSQDRMSMVSYSVEWDRLSLSSGL